VAAAHADHRVEAGALRSRPRCVGPSSKLVEAAERQGRNRCPDAQRTVELARRDALEQPARERLVGERRFSDGGGGELDFQRQRSLSSTAICPAA
jgi:hypothetical protein